MSSSQSQPIPDDREDWGHIVYTEHFASLKQQLIMVMVRHVGGWIGNGDPANTHCGCGHKGSLGEWHGSHVVDDIIATLQKNGIA